MSRFSQLHPSKSPFIKKSRFPCEECDIVYESSRGLRKHRKEKHCENQGFPCRHIACPEYFKSSYQRGLHEKNKHGFKVLSSRAISLKTADSSLQNQSMKTRTCRISGCPYTFATWEEVAHHEVEIHNFNFEKQDTSKTQKRQGSGASEKMHAETLSKHCHNESQQLSISQSSTTRPSRMDKRSNHSPHRNSPLHSTARCLLSEGTLHATISAGRSDLAGDLQICDDISPKERKGQRRDILEVLSDREKETQIMKGDIVLNFMRDEDFRHKRRRKNRE